jgi:hypothetical protein
MRGAVMGRHVAVLDLDQHGAAPVDEQGAERVIAMGHAAAGDVERSPQEVHVAFQRAQRG